MKKRTWLSDHPEPGGGARQKLITKLSGSTLFTTLSPSRISDWALFNIQRNGKKELIGSLDFTKTHSLYISPKRIRSSSELSKQKYRKLIKPIYIREFGVKGAEEEKIRIKKVIETLKLYRVYKGHDFKRCVRYRKV